MIFGLIICLAISNGVAFYAIGRWSTWRRRAVQRLKTIEVLQALADKAECIMGAQQELVERVTKAATKAGIPWEPPTS